MDEQVNPENPVPEVPLTPIQRLLKKQQERIVRLAAEKAKVNETIAARNKKLLERRATIVTAERVSKSKIAAANRRQVNRVHYLVGAVVLAANSAEWPTLTVAQLWGRLDPKDHAYVTEVLPHLPIGEAATVAVPAVAKEKVRKKEVGKGGNRSKKKGNGAPRNQGTDDGKQPGLKLT